MNLKSPTKLRMLFPLLVVLFGTQLDALAAPDWPAGRTVAVTLTFDLDAETVWWSDAATMSGNPGSISAARYGPKTAVPKILQLLQQHNLVATFFIPAWVAENYPDTVRSIVAAGHEIGAHGVKHESPLSLAPAEELHALRESIRVLETFTGKRPAGYRAPSWAVSDVSFELAASEGFLYSSNRMDADVPYLHLDPPGLVELPVSWVLDDAPFFWFDEDSWNRKIHSAAEVRAIWQEEFIAAYNAGGYINLTLHPQIIGRPARLQMLNDFIGWMKAFDGVWITSCEQVARHVAAP